MIGHHICHGGYNRQDDPKLGGTGRFTTYGFAVGSVFRRRLQCWHLHRLHNCWFSRRERIGSIACDAPAVRGLRARFGDAATACRVPSTGPLSSIDEYAANGQDLFYMRHQFTSWLSCRTPRCAFDILVLRYESLNASLSTLFNFLELPSALRRTFPFARMRRGRHTRHNHAGPLSKLYARLEEAVTQLPAEGLLLLNSQTNWTAPSAA